MSAEEHPNPVLVTDRSSSRSANALSLGGVITLPHWRKPVLARDITTVRHAFLNGGLTRDDLALRVPPLQAPLKWNKWPVKMRGQKEVLFSHQAETTMNDTWDKVEEFVHDRDIQMILYLRSFAMHRWVLPLERAIACVDVFLQREEARQQERSIFEEQRRISDRARPSQDAVKALGAVLSDPRSVVSGSVSEPSRSAAAPSSTHAAVSALAGCHGAPRSTRSGGAPRAAAQSIRAPKSQLPSRIRMSMRSAARSAALQPTAAAASSVATQSVVPLASSRVAARVSSRLAASSSIPSRSAAPDISANSTAGNGSYAASPIPGVILSVVRVNDRATNTIDPSNFPWTQARSHMDSSRWTDDIYYKRRLRDLEAVQSGNEPRVRQLLADERKKDTVTKNTSADKKEKSTSNNKKSISSNKSANKSNATQTASEDIRKRPYHLEFSDQESRNTCERLLGTEDAEEAIEIASGNPDNAALSKLTIFYISDTPKDLQPHNFSLLDAVRTRKYLDTNTILTHEAALRIIDFCPHLLVGNTLLRVTAEGRLSYAEIRYRYLLNGVSVSSNLVSKRTRVALGHGWAVIVGKVGTEGRKEADAWVDGNAEDFQKYKQEFMEEGEEMVKKGKGKAKEKDEGLSSSLVKTPERNGGGVGKGGSRKRDRQEEEEEEIMKVSHGYGTRSQKKQKMD